MATQVEWLRRDLKLYVQNIEGHTKLIRLLCEKFAELREMVKKQASRK